MMIMHISRVEWNRNSVTTGILHNLVSYKTYFVTIMTATRSNFSCGISRNRNPQDAICMLSAEALGA